MGHLHLKAGLLVCALQGCTGYMLEPSGHGDDPNIPGVPGQPGPSEPTPVEPECTPRGPGHATLRRFTNDQYLNALQDLLALPTRPVATLPVELLSPAGFDTNGEHQTFGVDLAQALLDVSSAAIHTAFTRPGATLPGCAGAARDTACLRSAVERFGLRAFRRALTSAERDAYVKISTDAITQGATFDQAAELGLLAVAMSPKFLYQFIWAEQPGDTASVHRLSGAELATRLAAVVWASVPDEALLADAENGTLETDAGLRAAATRMLQDPKAARFSAAFASQWLHTRELPDVFRATSVIATFDDALRTSMKNETDAFFADLVANNRDPLRLIDADYTFVDDRLAAFYGIAPAGTPGSRRVELQGTQRKGVLTHAGIMTVTSRSDRTSPVARGIFFLSQMVCSPPGAPPPDASTDLTKGPNGQDLTGLPVREQMRLHASEPRCAGCHSRIDPIGLAFEHFDAVGRYRATYAPGAIDTAGTLAGVGSFDDHLGLVTLLAQQRERDFKRCVTRQLMTFAIGRAMTGDDSCTINRIADGLQPGHGMTDLIVAIASNDSFRAQRGGP